MDKYLALWLEGPIQSYGINSTIDNSFAESFPSRSAIIGIILSSMGKGGSQAELLLSFKKLSQTIIYYHHINNKNPKRLRDIRMVGSGYNDKNKGKNPIMKKNSNRSKRFTTIKPTYRYYLQDVAFGVIFQLPKNNDLKNKIINSIQNPVWDTFLGRKNCAPTEFLYQGVFDSEEECEEKFKQLSENKNYQEYCRVYDTKVENSQKVKVNDVPVDFSIHKKYETRNIYIVR